MTTITGLLGKWYRGNKRDLPWRKGTSAYEIWISEIILQQTRVDQGLPYYLNFLQKFPDIVRLADASLDDVLKVWQGLGYYSRARNLHAAAKIVVEQYRGELPPDVDQLLLLKGIGEYTAAAIASIAYGIPVALVDGNVYRVLARLFSNPVPVNTPEGKKEFLKLAESLLDKKSPGTHNQAMMELGALICLPRNPECSRCPLKGDCSAFREGKVDHYPVKAGKSKTRKRYFHYLYIRYKKKTFIRQRNHRDIWKSLYEFPLIETGRPFSALKLYESPSWKALFRGTAYSVVSVSGPLIHPLSHQTLVATIYCIDIEKITPLLINEYRCIDIRDLRQYPVSRLTEKFLDALLKQKLLN